MQTLTIAPEVALLAIPPLLVLVFWLALWRVTVRRRRRNDDEQQ
jgi:hypothetical protein